MVKVAYNACFGGFSLSEKAVRLGREKSGEERWAGATLPGEMYSDGSGPCTDVLGMGSVHIDYEFPRHDPILIEVIEELGGEASGALANLQIAEVNGPYRIDEYDGNETVETPSSYDWIDPTI